MMILALITQMGFGFALPREGPLVPYRECVTAMLARSPLEQLRYEAVAAGLEAECGRLLETARPSVIDAAVERAARAGSPIARQEFERLLPMLLQLGIRRAIDEELEARGIDPHPPSRLPFEVPRPEG